ncbi:Nitrite reductase (NAD(P)H) [Pseudodesulfovibrio mercurii]|uniref:Nitrite reductase (NAD(P)H) n=1 Tax=Pseudodesulfovibrio mercurii TaxID=641491 RepID=F0JEV7_9BACT|nr:nitrite reductase [Pseudodesulfovibrio mercurii]EGB13592.1 Nitrite reductase (NAD(P)H) [Pseudodesulfovibrio mercurii]
MNMEAYIAGLPKGAVRPRKDGTYTVVPRMRLGQMDADLLEAVTRAVRDNGLAGVRLAASQRLMIDNVPASALRSVVEAVGLVGDAYRYKVQGCLGSAGCKLGQQDSLGAADRLERMLADFSLPAKLKTGVSGCPMCCAESLVRDVGLFGKKHGWTVTFGGNGGKRVRQGDILAEDVSEAEAFAVIRKALAFYAAQGKVKERTARFVERVGVEAVRDAVGAAIG